MFNREIEQVYQRIQCRILNKNYLDLSGNNV